MGTRLTVIYYVVEGDIYSMVRKELTADNHVDSRNRLLIEPARVIRWWVMNQVENAIWGSVKWVVRSKVKSYFGD